MTDSMICLARDIAITHDISMTDALLIVQSVLVIIAQHDD